MNDQAKFEATAAGVEAPDRSQFRGDRGNGYVLLGILALLTLGFLYLARDILLPVAIAFLFAIVLGPVVRWLARHRVPAPVSASAIVIVLLMGFTSMGYLLLGPVAAIVADAPRIGNEIQEKFSVLRRPVAAIGRATAQIESIVSPDDGTEKVVVDVSGGAVIGDIAADAGQRLAAMGLSLVLLFFILASGDLFQEKLIKILPTLSDKKRALRIARDVEREVSHYLFTVASINIGLGILVGLAFWQLGMPSPILWAIFTTLANFIPYIGAGIVALTSFGIAVVSFDTLGQILLPPFVFLIFTALEGQVITPMIVGQRHALNAVVILLSITFWGWIWGIIGALIAVPLLVTAKVFADHVDGFRSLGEFLGARPTPEASSEEDGGS